MPVSFGTKHTEDPDELHQYEGGGAGSVNTASSGDASMNENGEIISRSTVSDHSSYDDDGTASGSASTGASSTSTADSVGNMKFRNGLKCLRKVPFEVQVIVVLMVPILFLISFSSKNLAVAVNELNYVETKHGLMAHMTEFEHDLMAERSLTGPYYAAMHANDTKQQIEAYSAYREAMAITDEEWVVLQHEISPFATEDPVMSRTRDRIVEAMSYLKLNRENVRHMRETSTHTRNNYTKIITESQGILRSMSRHGHIGHSLPTIVVLMNARRFSNYLGAAQSSGNEIVASNYAWTHDPKNADAVHRVTSEFEHEVLNAIESEHLTEDVATGYAATQLEKFFHDEETLHAIELMHKIEHQGVDANVTSKDWYETMQHTMKKFDDVLLDLADAHLGDAAKAYILEESLQMVFGTLISLLASSFIVFWQIRIAENIKRQQDHTRRVNTVISSFVPKTFLHTMGCRSIMQISTGQQVNVATTMLFSDIRNFTNLSERMNNDDLFDWLQKYFALMTRVNDRHNGTIDKFIGDAIFSFFPVAANAIKCGIDMQSIVVFLNSTLTSENLVQLGVGIHHGVVAFGVFGDANRRSCTMVSSEVNLASRLEGLTKQFGVRIICSDSVMDQINPSFFPLDVINPVDLAEGKDPNSTASMIEKRIRPSFNEDGSMSAKHELGCRFLGCVVVKGSCRVLKIHEIFQSDDVHVRKYKSKSKSLFEEAVHLQEEDLLKKTDGHMEKAVEKEAEYNPLRNRESFSDNDDGEKAGEPSNGDVEQDDADPEGATNPPPSQPGAVEQELNPSKSHEFDNDDEDENTLAIPVEKKYAVPANGARQSIDIDSQDGAGANDDRANLLSPQGSTSSKANGKSPRALTQPPTNDVQYEEDTDGLILPNMNLPVPSKPPLVGSPTNVQSKYNTQTGGMEGSREFPSKTTDRADGSRVWLGERSDLKDLSITSANNTTNGWDAASASESLFQLAGAQGRRQFGDSIRISSATQIRVMSLLKACKKIADEYGVEDPVLAIKVKSCRRGGGLEKFGHK